MFSYCPGGWAYQLRYVEMLFSYISTDRRDIKIHQRSSKVSRISQSVGAATLTEPKGTCARCSPERGTSGCVAVWKLLLSPEPSPADAWTGTPLEFGTDWTAPTELSQK